MATRRLTVIAGGGLLALALSACGGDNPELMQESLDSAAPTLAFVDDEHSTCAAEAILDHITFEQLVADGHTSESIAADPTSIKAIVESHESTELRTSLTGCLDVNSLFRDRLAERNGGEQLTCNTTFVSGTDLVDQFLDQRFDGVEGPLTINDTDEHRDLLRPCFSEANFAEAFDIDLAGELGPAITHALPKQVAATPCAGEAIVQKFGAEELNDMGVTVANPAFDFDALDLDSTDEENVLEAIADCSELAVEKRRELRMDQPSHGACAMDAVESKWVSTMVRDAMGKDRGSEAEWLLDDEPSRSWAP